MSDTLTKPPVFAVCLTRQELHAARAVLRFMHGHSHEAEFCPSLSMHEVAEARHALGRALTKVHNALLDAGGVDDTK